MDFSGHASHATAVVIDDVIIIGRRCIYCASTLLGRCLCKRVDVYIITLSCTWRIYALSECLLVNNCGYWTVFFCVIGFKSGHTTSSAVFVCGHSWTADQRNGKQLSTGHKDHWAQEEDVYVWGRTAAWELLSARPATQEYAQSWSWSQTSLRLHWDLEHGSDSLVFFYCYYYYYYYFWTNHFVFSLFGY